ncbi:MAG: hypothetical protein JWO20_3351 [Candidatus Angelobacter sp.]|jgi:hypothetical protein|nr:hypothetical protein [Candidatus Angelobacter sp.]
MSRLGFLSVFIFIVLGTALGQGTRLNREEPRLSIRSDPKFSIRILESHVVLADGATRTCLIVYPDNSFHFEKLQRSFHDASAKKPYVTESTLTASEADQLSAIIQDSAIAKLEGGVPHRKALSKDSHELSFQIPRKNSAIQSIDRFSSELQEVDPAVKPIVSLLRSIDSRDLPPQLRDARADICKPPTPARAPSPR